MSAGARNQPIKPHKTMCLFHTRINGVRYNLTQLRALYEKSCEENALLKKELEESKKREALANKLYNEEKNKVTAKNIEIKDHQEQLADFPARDKNGRFKKR